MLVKVSFEYDQLCEFSLGLITLQVLPFLDVRDIVNLVQMIISTDSLETGSNFTENTFGECKLLPEAVKWLSWKADGLPEEAAQKLAHAYPTAKDLASATRESIIANVGSEAGEQVNLVLNGDYYIE